MQGSLHCAFANSATASVEMTTLHPIGYLLIGYLLGLILTALFLT